MQNERTTLGTSLPVSLRFSNFVNWLNRGAKRLFDILVALTGIIVLAPIVGMIAVAIKRDSPGPVFYRGQRMGYQGKIFRILKFRTMHEIPQSYDGPAVTAEDDPRITLLGKWLRDTKLNELPQLWNVLLGDMSIVGPRPEDPSIVAAWPKKVRSLILSVRPGITSPASVIYRSEEKLLKSESLMDDYLNQVLPDKLRLDQLYVRNNNFLGDLDILFLTAVALFPRLKEISFPENQLFWGPFSIFVSRYVSWAVIDTMVAFFAVGVAGILWRLGEPLHLGLPIALGVAAGIALLFSLINSILGLGRISWQQARPVYAIDLVFSSGLATGIVFLVNRLMPSGELLPSAVVLNAGLMACLGFMAVRYRERLLTGLATRWLSYRRDAGSYGERVLVVGAGECGQLAVWLLHKSNLANAYSVVGMVDDDPRKVGMVIEGQRVLGLIRDVQELVKQYDVGLIMYAISSIEPREERKILALCNSADVRLVIIPDMLNIFRKHFSRRLGDGIN
ncbi:MAG: sugar transferase [Anaerolineales bacterium]|nr:sugar transferase [Anaerolineales bacterium]